MATSVSPTRNISKASEITKVTPKIRKNASTIPDSIIHNESLNATIRLLPTNYNFEIHKSIWKILDGDVKIVALQFPEGLLMYSCIISDIIGRFTGANVLILGDVTYGACCIDDYTAHKLGATLLIHYGHSCLVPVNVTRIKVSSSVLSSTRFIPHTKFYRFCMFLWKFSLNLNIWLPQSHKTSIKTANWHCLERFNSQTWFTVRHRN